MSMFRFTIATVLLLALSTPAASAESEAVEGAAADAQLDVLVGAIRSDRKAFVALNLPLTDEEAARFWPLYERYQKEAAAVGDRQVAIIEDYIASFSGLSDEKARQILDGYLATEAERLEVRRSYVGQFADVLPGRKLAAFYQLENKIDAVLRYELAATIPVIEANGGAPAGQ